jgi:hypothetical protein
MVAGVVLLLVGFGQTWSAIELTTGQTITLSGIDQSPLALSLVLVSVAAYALSLLLFGLGHRVSSAVQLVAGLGALGAAIGSLQDPIAQAGSEITLLTGLSGEETLSSLVAGVSFATLAVGSGVAGMGLMAVSGVFGLIVSRVPKNQGSRFDRPGQGPAEHPWDQLSDGVDPTDL